MWVQSLGWEDPLEKEMVTHASIPAWRIPRTEEPGGIQSMGHKELDTTEQLTHTHHSKGKAYVRGGTLMETAHPGQAP